MFTTSLTTLSDDGGWVNKPDQWTRAGSGRELQFFATDDDIDRWLLNLTPKWSPYNIWVCDSTVAMSESNVLPIHFPPEDWKRYTTGPQNRRWKFWISSERLSPSGLLNSESVFDHVASLSGLIGLQHGLLVSKGIESSRIAIVPKIRHLESDRTIMHSHYGEIFRTFAKTIEKDLVYRAIRVLKNGEEVTDTARMTEFAADAYANGLLFTARPGERLK
jgi:hypothetical protein